VISGTRALFLSTLCAIALSGCAASPAAVTPALAIKNDLALLTKNAHQAEELRFPLSAYYACEAFKEDNPALCGPLDNALPKHHEYAPDCRTLYHQGRMIRNAALNGTGVKDCVAMAQHSEQGKKDADSPQEAQEFCAGLIPLYAKGDPAKVCDYMYSVDNEYDVEYVSQLPKKDRETCLKENIFLRGDPALCPRAGDQRSNQHCRAKALLVRASKTNDPELAAGTFYATLLNREAKCNPLRKNIQAALSPRLKASYNSPEELLMDYSQLAQGHRKADTLNLLMSDYFACKALSSGKISDCDAFDQYTPDRGNTTDFGGSHCKEAFFQAKIIRDAFDGSNSLSACIETEKEDGETDSDAKNLCRKISAGYRQGDPKNLCSIIHSDDDSAAERKDADRCLAYHRFITGDEGKCLKDQGSYFFTQCTDRVRLLRAVRENTPAIAKGTPFGPFVGAGDCSAAGKRALKEFNSLRGSLTQAGPLTADKLIDRFEILKREIRFPAGVQQLLSEYLSCRSFEVGNTNPCGRIDSKTAITDPDDIDGSHCREEFYQGRLVVESFAEPVSIQTCLNDELKEEEEEEEGTRRESERFCRSLAAAYTSGDPAKVCDVIHSQEEPSDSASGAQRCLSHHLGLTGKVSDCSRLKGLHREHCQSLAKLVSAVKMKRPALARDTLFAPLIDAQGGCEGAGRRALKEYEDAKRRSLTWD
jgi:hypothetical protein